MKSRLTVTFDSGWLDDRRSNGVRVVRLLEKWIARDAEVKLVSSSATSLTVEMTPVHRADFTEALGRELVETFGEASPWEHATFAGDVDGLDVPMGKGKVATAAPRPDAEEKKPEGGAADSEADAAKPEEPSPDPRKTVDEICASVPVKHSREMTAYVRETAAIIPTLQKLGVVSNLWHQHLLLALDEGYGRSDFLSGLARIYSAFGLLKGEVDDKTVREIIVCTGREESDERYRLTWKEVLEVARETARSNAKNGLTRAVLYLDISAWQGKLASSEVKRHLRWLNRFTGSFLIVFRVPFLEAHVLRDISDALNDILNVRTLAVPPLPIGDMADYARAKFEEQGFSLAPDASDVFEQWILYEKGDDSFFGYKTMDKIVRRAIYEKARADCAADSDDRVLRVEDIRPFARRDNDGDDPAAELDALVGLDVVKQRLREIIVQIQTQKSLSSKGRKVKRPAIHMVFTGNPGTGKTTVARLVARMMRDAGILRKGHLFEVKARDLCGQFIGETAPKTNAYCRDAYGSVLFIDEAYSLFRDEYSSARDYGREALDTLVAEMENHRDDFCVIMAGYKDDMDAMLKGNAGLRSRIPFEIEFPNYSREDLEKIFFSMIDGTFDYERELKGAVKDFFTKIPDEVLKAKEFSNARFVRNLYERVWGKAAYRRSFNGDEPLRILASDLVGAAEDREFKHLLSDRGPDRRTIGFGIH